MINNINLNKWIEDGFHSCGFKKLTNIQEKTIPLILKHKNLIGISATGTGKTFCFLLPIFQKLDFNNKAIQAIIVAPTRELARQIFSQVQIFKNFNKQLKCSLLIGGSEIEKQINTINKQQPQILVCTITRLKELTKKNCINLRQVNTIVLDEADMLMDLGFSKDIDYIFDLLAKNNNLQKLAFSATLHDLLSQKLSKYFTNTKIVKIGKSIYDNPNIKHHIIHTHDKSLALKTFVKNIKPYLCIIFANKKNDINQIVQLLKQENIEPLIIHGSLQSRDRKNAYKRIKNLEAEYVVASDLASRGLDIDGASHIINWDLPDDLEWYIHRAGRSGRGKYQGDAYILFDGNNENKLLTLQNKGINFDHLDIKKGNFQTKNYQIKTKPKLLDDKTNQEIRKITSKNEKVKPGYKKKRKTKIEKLKQKSKRKYLESVIKEQRIKKYKQNNHRGE